MSNKWLKGMRQNVSGCTAAIVGASRPATSRIIVSLCLVKLGKYLALLASLLILGQTAGHFRIGELAIFAIIVFSAVSHWCGKTWLARAQLKRS